MKISLRTKSKLNLIAQSPNYLKIIKLILKFSKFLIPKLKIVKITFKRKKSKVRRCNKKRKLKIKARKRLKPQMRLLCLLKLSLRKKLKRRRQ